MPVAHTRYHTTAYAASYHALSSLSVNPMFECTDVAVVAEAVLQF